MSRYPMFQRERIQLLPISERGHDLMIASITSPSKPKELLRSLEFNCVISAVVHARKNGHPVIVMIGGHPIKLGLSRFLIQLMERGLITHLATNGAGIIHDFELALVGGTSENVSQWIQAGQFGLWKETSRLNEIIHDAADANEGLGESIGRTIVEQRFPHQEVSLCAAGWRLGIPVTSHVTIGGDITHPHANCDGAALGAASYTDFLIFAHSVQNLEAGVFLNIGSAVTGPEVYLKALSMARNVAHQTGKRIRHFTTAVFDLIPLPGNWRDGTPLKDDPFYYYRPWKTILTRTVQDGGQSFYIQADHRLSIPSLWHALTTDGAVAATECSGSNCPTCPQ